MNLIIDMDRLQSLAKAILQCDIGPIAEWRCDPIGPVNGNFVTGGVYRISGLTDVGNGTARPWSLILKIVKADPARDDPAHYNYWRREVMVYGSGLLRRLPATITAPQCYAIDDKDDGTVWLWLEDMKQEARQWERMDYAFAAGTLGRFQAAYLLGEPLPDYPWLSARWMRSWIHECYRYRPEHATNSSSDARAAAIIRSFNELEGSVNDWLTALEHLPRTFAHQDYYEQNIMLSSDRQQEESLAIIDWQFASLSGIGEDLGRFLGLSVSRGQVPINRFKEYRELFISSYIKGLRDAGWLGDEQLPRFGCLAAFALRSIWEVPKLLHKLEQEPDSPEIPQLMAIAELQLEAAAEAERLRTACFI